MAILFDVPLSLPPWQVEFAPTFEETVMDKQWSWDQNQVNLTCIATGIPNATITWWYRDREIGREIIDRNYIVSPELS